jgi:uncharacterized membrane protein
MKDKLRSKKFWLSLAAAVVVLLQCLGVKIDAPVVNEAVCTVCGVLVLIGLITDDVKKENDETEESQDEDRHELYTNPREDR